MQEELIESGLAVVKKFFPHATYESLTPTISATLKFLAVIKNPLLSDVISTFDANRLGIWGGIRIGDMLCD